MPDLSRLCPVWLYRVSGHSMKPAYQPGDTLLGWRGPFKARAGRVVVARQSGRTIIKRVAGVSGSGVYVLGDNAPGSTDSRHFGPLPRASVEAVVLLKLP